MSNRIDLTQFEGIMSVEWLFDEQLFVGKQNRWRFAINEYTDTETMSEKEYEEWENGLGPVWDSLTSAVACLPDLIAELKRCYNLIDRYDSTVSLLSDGEDSTGCNGDLTVVKLSACHALYDLRDLSQRVS